MKDINLVVQLIMKALQEQWSAKQELMFLQSSDNRNLRYTVFVGDRDSATYGKVRESCAEMYGDTYPVAKKRCVGHIQKKRGLDYENTRGRRWV